MDKTINKNQIFIIPTESKPIKVYFEENCKSNISEEKYNTTEKDVLLETLYDIRHKISSSQYRTERGKIKRNKDINSVYNFFLKRGITKEFIKNKIGLEDFKTIVDFIIPYGVGVSKLKDASLGYLNLED